MATPVAMYEMHCRKEGKAGRKMRSKARAIVEMRDNKDRTCLWKGLLEVRIGMG